jgi:hypothetical protein
MHHPHLMLPKKSTIIRVIRRGVCGKDETEAGGESDGPTRGSGESETAAP